MDEQKYNEAMYQATIMERPNAMTKRDNGSRVTQEQSLLSKSIAELHETFDMLRSKLEPVIGVGVAAMDGTSAGNTEEALSPLAESLRSEMYRVRRLNDAMRDLIQRLEV